MTMPHDETGDEPSLYAASEPGALLALPASTAADHDPAPSWWSDLVTQAMASAAPGPADGDDLDVVLEGIVIPAPTPPPTPAATPSQVILGQAVKPVPAPAAPTAPPVSPTRRPVPPVPPAPPVPPRPTQAPAAGGSGGGSGAVPPASAPADTEPDGQEPEDVTPPAWWTRSARLAAADRVAWEIGGDHAATARTRVSRLFDLPEDGAEPQRKPTRAERTRTRDAAGAERARRFRRWSALTVLSATIGAEVHLPQAFGAVISGAWDAGGQWMGTGAAGFLIFVSWSVDWYLRGGTRPEGATRIGDIRRGRLPVLAVVRVPFASALLAGLGADGLLTAMNLSVHQLFS
ncbi:hypothetical protein [Kitasatospora sp. NPDC056184]|uniref:hypothetical protein n=1 Tax=Kitasatospora sp. NPDC056184 TaxID=3345738 RepID=UPI0035DCDE56